MGQRRHHHRTRSHPPRCRNPLMSLQQTSRAAPARPQRAAASEGTRTHRGLAGGGGTVHYVCGTTTRTRKERQQHTHARTHKKDTVFGTRYATRTYTARNTQTVAFTTTTHTGHTHTTQSKHTNAAKHIHSPTTHRGTQQQLPHAQEAKNVRVRVTDHRLRRHTQIAHTHTIPAITNTHTHTTPHARNKRTPVPVVHREVARRRVAAECVRYNIRVLHRRPVSRVHLLRNHYPPHA